MTETTELKGRLKMYLKLHAQWTDNFLGKKDYDARIVEISTSYRPQGRGFMFFDTSRPDLGLRDSAKSMRQQTKCQLCTYHSPRW